MSWKLAAVAVGGLVVLCLVVLVVRSARRLDDRIRRIREENEAANPTETDPYQALADLYSQEDPR